MEFLEETSTQKMYWDATHEIVLGELIANIDTLEKAIENMDAQERIRDKTNKTKSRILVDTTNYPEMPKVARDYFSNERSATIQAAVALYTTSSVGKFFGNLAISLSKPLTPTKLFTDKEEAIKWLCLHKND